jgi:hypothetical protein
VAEMSDFEKLIELLENFGISFEAESGKGSRKYDGEVKYNLMVTIQNGIGYYDFHTEFYFMDEAFVGYGVWE